MRREGNTRRDATAAPIPRGPQPRIEVVGSTTGSGPGGAWRGPEAAAGQSDGHVGAGGVACGRIIQGIEIGGAFKGRQLFPVIAHAQFQGEFRRDLPVVLEEEALIVHGETKERVAETLDEGSGHPLDAVI